MPRIWPLAVTALAFVVGYVQKLPCHLAGWPWQRELIFGKYCYSDISILYRSRGLIDGTFPYSPETPEHPLEYPVVTGYVMDLTARLTNALVPGADEAGASRMYFTVNVIVLLAFACAMVWGTAALLRQTGGRPGDVIMVAAAPTLVLAGTINWDLVAVAAAVFAVLAWVRDRPWLAGVLIGVGAATKLFPAFILGPLLILCLRQKNLRGYWKCAAAAAATWLALNLPVWLAYPDGWVLFYRFNADRGPDFGSFWYALERLGYNVPEIDPLAMGSFVLLCAGIAALAWWARRPPTVAQVTFLVFAAFLVTNKVYSPQYVLWMLPFAVLARSGAPFEKSLRDFLIWQAAEVLYWAMVWKHLGWTLTDIYTYPVSTFVRIAATLYLCGQVVHDVLADRPVPEEEPEPDQPGQVAATV